MGYILHIDTSADFCSVSIGSDGVLLRVLEGEAARDHAGRINVMISEILNVIDANICDLAAVAVCSGPGSYTGLRIGMSVAKGICYALDIPLILNDRLLLLAAGLGDQESCDSDITAVVLQAREKEYFVGIFKSVGICLQQPLHLLEAELPILLNAYENLHIISDADSEKFYQLKVNFLTISDNIKIKHQSWAIISNNFFKHQDFANLSAAIPLYLKQVYTHKSL